MSILCQALDSEYPMSCIFHKILCVRYGLRHSKFTTGMKKISVKLFTVLKASQKILFGYLPLTLSPPEAEDKNKRKEKAVEKEM